MVKRKKSCDAHFFVAPNHVKAHIPRIATPTTETPMTYAEQVAQSLPKGIEESKILDAAFQHVKAEMGLAFARGTFLMDEDFRDEVVTAYLSR
jgi:Lhr-like helicase